MPTSVFSWTESAERFLDAMLVVVDGIFLDRRLEFLVAMVDAPIVNLLL